MDADTEQLTFNLFNAGVPSSFHDKTLGDYGNYGSQVKKLLLEADGDNVVLPNILFNNKDGFGIGYAVARVYCMVAKSGVYCASLSDIIASRDFAVGNINYGMVKRSEEFLKALDDRPNILFISDFVPDEKSDDGKNVNLEMYGGNDYGMLSNYIKDRLLDKNLTTLLYSCDSSISHCWTKSLVEVLIKNVMTI